MSIAISEKSINNPYKINKMGTSGLRQTQEIYNQPFFLEQFAQGMANFFLEIKTTIPNVKNNDTILLGGDPRKGNDERIKKIAEIFVANGFKIIIAENGLATTPSMSHGIRLLKVAGGIILTASHNPFTDVGIKVNIHDGSPALEDSTEKINMFQNNCSKYLTTDFDKALQKKQIEYVNIIKIYADLLDSIFSFKKMKEQLQTSQYKLALDSMHGAAGPFAEEVFANRLAIKELTMLRQEPREDLGGFNDNGEPCHPEPDFDYVDELIKLNNTKNYDLVAAWDSDVDRRLDGGKGFFLESADEFALFAKYSELINVEKLFQDTIYFCRSTVTAHTIDLMNDFLAQKYSNKKTKTAETPTGFKWIAELGNWGVEESNGVGNPYLREKDGIFATVFLLKILLHTDKTPLQLMENIWKEFGRVYFTRGEISGSEISEKNQLIQIFNNANDSINKKFGRLILESAYSWNYKHPKSNSIVAKNVAWVLNFNDGNTVKARFSGTGSGGYTLRVYCSKFDKKYNIPKSEITKPMKEALNEFLTANGFNKTAKKFTDEHQPDVYLKK